MSLAPGELSPPPPMAEELLAEMAPPGGTAAPLIEVVARSAKRARRNRRLGLGSPPKRVRGRRVRPRRVSSRSEPLLVAPGELAVGILAGLNDAGEPLVRHPLGGSGQVILARSTISIDAGHLDREVVLAFERGDPGRPIILGVLRRPGESGPSTPLPARVESSVKATADGEALVFTAEREIVLRCGDASITLTRAGKVLIRGTYLLSRSSGVNRIKGGSVQIN